jgi:serine/threonine-protein kinase
MVAAIPAFLIGVGQAQSGRLAAVRGEGPVADQVVLPWTTDSFVIGARIAGYRLEEKIGMGGMAVVFRAHDERLNRQVGLKILAPVLASDMAFRQRFIRESRAAAAVDDPNIIPVYEAGESEGVLFIAMRLVRGGDLRSLVARHGPLPPDRAEWIVSAVASALDASHAAGLVHRDVKPANMLLDVRPGRPDHVYLSDFGLTKGSLSSSSLTGSGHFLGTVDYAAPEQIQGGEVDGRTDQYALGCAAFELLCGRPPFQRDQGLAAVYAHLSEPPPSLASLRTELPAKIDEVFARVLAKSPANRYSCCQEFADALRSALGLRPHPASSAQRRDTDVVVLAGPSATEAIGAADAGQDMPDLPTSDDQVEPHTSDPVPASTALAAEPPEAAAPTADHAAELSAVAAALPPSRPADPEREPSPGRMPSRRRRWPLALTAATVAATVAATAAAATWLLLPGSPAPRTASQSATYYPLSRTYADGLVIALEWRLSGHGGSLLTVTITASNPTGTQLDVPVEEPIPAIIAANLKTVAFTPVPSKIMNSEPVVRWDLRIPPHGATVIRYRVRVPPTGATGPRLIRFAASANALAARLGTVPVPVQSLAITPRVIHLTKGTTVRLILKGLQPDGTTVLTSALSGVIWTTQNKTVAVVSPTGKITGIRAGRTRVTARLGRLSVTVIVTVRAPSAPNPGTSYPSQQPSSHSTPRPTPTTVTPTP